MADLDDAAVSQNLRSNLAHLARLLEPDRSNNEATFFVRSEANTVTLGVGTWLRVDAIDFEADLDQAIAAERRQAPAATLEAYERALARYRGPFLADAWSADRALRERQRVAGRYVRAATRAGDLFIGMGRPEEASDRASRARAVDP
jgi:DNA-binding SARP family transcriptional activator